MAGVLGFEPRMSVPKTNALPLGYTPTIMPLYINVLINQENLKKIMIFQIVLTFN